MVTGLLRNFPVSPEASIFPLYIFRAEERQLKQNLSKAQATYNLSAKGKYEDSFTVVKY